MQTFRPNKTVFLLRPVAWTAAFVVPLAVAAAITLHHFDHGLASAVPVLVGLLGCAFVYFERSVAYDKTSYEIDDHQLIHKTGVLLADRTTKLPFRNVTQLELRLPWIEHLIYSTGHISVHAAGSSKGRVKLTSVDDPEALYDAFEQALRDNGFALRRDQIIQQEKPHVIGALLDTVGDKGGPIPMAGVALTFVGFLLAGVTAVADGGLVDDFGFLIAGALIVASLISGAIVRFLDLNARTYTVWDDLVDYEDGFLTRTKKLIPVANLADTHVEETFAKRIFGMADIVISCQGDSGDIHFPSTPSAKSFCHSLDQLIRRIDRPEPPPTTGDATDGTVNAGDADHRRFAPPDLTTAAAGDETRKIHIPSYAPSSIGALLVIVIFVGSEVISDLGNLSFGAATVGLCITLFATALVGSIGAGFAWLTRTYTFGTHSVSFVREVLTQRDSTEFSNDKITAVAVHRNPINRLFGTATLKFYSIGHDEVLKFPHMPDYDDLGRLLAERFDLPFGEPTRRIDPAPTPLSLFSAGLIPLATLLVLAILAAVATTFAPVMLAVAAVIFALIPLHLISKYIEARFIHVDLHDHHVMLRSGWLFQKQVYVPVHQARNVATVQYPGTDRGRLEIESGGKNASFSVPQLMDLEELHDALDQRLYESPPRPMTQPTSFDTTEVDHWHPQARNAMITYCGLAAITVIGIPLILLIAPYIRAYYKRATDHIETRRLLQYRGVFFRRRATVLLNRIDQVQTARKPLHTLCKNGIVEIYTLGGGGAELTFGPHPDFEEIESIIERQTT